MDGNSLIIRDQVTLPAEESTRWLSQLRSRYVPGAQLRGMHLEDIDTRKDGREDRFTQVTLTWSVKDTASFWSMRLRAEESPEVRNWWYFTDRIALHRHRQVFSPHRETPDIRTSLWKRWVVTLYWRNTASEQNIDRFLQKINSLSSRSREVYRSFCGRHLPESVGFGDATWDVTCSERPLQLIEDNAELFSLYNRAVMGSEETCLHPLKWAIYPDRLPPVKRTLLLCARGRDDEISLFERSLMAMPDHIASIGSWSLSTVSFGGWTHCFEQEFEDVSGFNLDYMESPYHISSVDPYFDIENPQRVVSEGYSHILYQADRSILHAPLDRYELLQSSR